jgi:hypothetical protein
VGSKQVSQHDPIQGGEILLQRIRVLTEVEILHHSTPIAAKRGSIPRIAVYVGRHARVYALVNGR